MEQGKNDGPLSRISNVLRIWDLSTFHPLVLRVNAQSLQAAEKQQMFKLLESYIVRRDLCGLTTKNYNKVVLGMVRQFLDEKEPVAAFQKHLSELTGDASRMPTNVEIAQTISRFDAYQKIPSPRLKFILQNIEYGKRNKFDEVTVVLSNLTIEHVMPQKWSKNWRLSNGITAPDESTFVATIAGHKLSDETKALMEARQRAVGTLGNLTLLTEALNPSIGNGPWKTKRERLSKSLLALNRSIAAIEDWNEAAIANRATNLASICNRLWAAQ